MNLQPAEVDLPTGEGDAGGPYAPPSPAHGALLGAVREDIRQTLRMGWTDPALEAASAFPTFFTAAWSAVRPNVSRSFHDLARAIRDRAADSTRDLARQSTLRRRLESSLAEEELRRVEESVRALHMAMPKVLIVVHAMHRAARRERIPGTGTEEPPARRGVPEWQRWMSTHSITEEARLLLREVASTLHTAGAPALFLLIARWPAALSASWRELRPVWGSEAWRPRAARIRRTVLAEIRALPHPIEIQWGALYARGFTEKDRATLIRVLDSHEASMPDQALGAAYAWQALGAPDIGMD